MKNLICLFLLVSMLCNTVFADCTWTTGITEGPNKTFIYNESCHQKVGQMVEDIKVKDQQIADYTKAIQLKDLAITASDQRVQLWEKTAGDEQDRLAKLSSAESQSHWLYFALGALTVIGSGFMTAKLIGK